MPEIVSPMTASNLSLFNGILLAGICVAVLGIHWLGKHNKRQEERIQAKRQARQERHAKA